MAAAAAAPAPGPAGPPGTEVRPAPGKGYGLFCTSAFSANQQVFTDEPLFVLQHTGNRRVVAACAHCCGFLGSLQAQLEVLFGEARFAPLLCEISPAVQRWQAELPGAAPVRCAQGCGEAYCSEACRDAHYRHSHNLLCVGHIDREDHPLIRFKYHAIEHTDTLLLAAQVFAHLINKARSCGGGPEVMRRLMGELLVFCHAPFRDACRAPPGRGKDAEFLAHTDSVVHEAAVYLQAALEAHAPAEVLALFENGPAFLSEVLGLFEYNNIDVEVPSQLGQFFIGRARALLPAAPADPQAAAELALIERLLREKELVMHCVWGEETTGIYGDDGDSHSEGDDDAAMEADDAAEEDADEAAMVSAAMEQAREKVDRLSLEQLLEAKWPDLHGTALFASVARINHSCSPNLKVDFPSNSARLTATSLAPLVAGDELCISYIRDQADVQVRRRQLLEYGFTCGCERCVREDSGESRKAQRRLK